MTPLRLHHGQVLQGGPLLCEEVRHCLLEEVRSGHEVRVEDGDELGVRQLPALLESAGLVALPVGAPDDLAVHPVTPGALCRRVHGSAGVRVGGVVQHLHQQAVARPADSARGLDAPPRHERLVEHRQLHADFGRARPRATRLGRPAPSEVADALRQPEDQEDQQDEVWGVREEHDEPWPAVARLAWLGGCPCPCAARDRGVVDRVHGAVCRVGYASGAAHAGADAGRVRQERQARPGRPPGQVRGRRRHPRQPARDPRQRGHSHQYCVGTPEAATRLAQVVDGTVAEGPRGRARDVAVRIDLDQVPSSAVVRGKVPHRREELRRDHHVVLEDHGKGRGAAGGPPEDAAEAAPVAQLAPQHVEPGLLSAAVVAGPVAL
mmetsp:Transcript_83648/g.245271  ORF Transcript_83648/g.245271 Transcript_83648/m.245271 type:complete len:378 (-) Transcript_83648:353-1486(-)